MKVLHSGITYAQMCLHMQVDLTVSSIRPALGIEEMMVMQKRLLSNVKESSAEITVHVSSWEHDSDQGGLLPKEKVNMHVYSFADHRLAFYLDSINQLEIILKDTIMVQQGFKNPKIALAA
jgi:hypothetical protein